MGKYFTPFSVLVICAILIGAAYDLGNKYLDQRAPAARETKK